MSYARGTAAAASMAATVAMLHQQEDTQQQSLSQQSSQWTFCRSCVPAMPIPAALAVRLSPCGCCLCKDCTIVFLAETRLQKNNWHCNTCQQTIMTLDACLSSTSASSSSTAILTNQNNNNNNNSMAAAGQGGNNNSLQRVTIRPTLQAATGAEGERRSAATAAAAAAKAGAKRKRAPSTAASKAKGGAANKTPAGGAAAAAALEGGSDTQTGTATTTTATKSGPGRKKRSRNKGFDERMRALVQFKKQFGHVYVPSNFKDDDGLYEWVKNVRSGNKNLTDDQRDALTAVGFVWEKDSVRRDRLWLESLDKLMAYKSRFGDCAVPWRWREDVALAEWVHTQRKKNSTSQLKPHRKEILESVGFEWAGKKGKRVDM